MTFKDSVASFTISLDDILYEDEEDSLESLPLEIEEHVNAACARSSFLSSIIGAGEDWHKFDRSGFAFNLLLFPTQKPHWSQTSFIIRIEVIDNYTKATEVNRDCPALISWPYFGWFPEFSFFDI